MQNNINTVNLNEIDSLLRLLLLIEDKYNNNHSIEEIISIINDRIPESVNNLLCSTYDNIDNKVSSIIKTQTKIDTEFNQYKEEMNKRIDDQTQKNTLSTSKDTDNENNKIDSVNWKVYIVKSGDTLFTICSKYNIDYYAWQKIILSTNGINDANKIYVGQALLIPILGSVK